MDTCSAKHNQYFNSKLGQINVTSELEPRQNLMCFVEESSVRNARTVGLLLFTMTPCFAGAQCVYPKLLLRVCFVRSKMRCTALLKRAFCSANACMPSICRPRRCLMCSSPLRECVMDNRKRNYSAVRRWHRVIVRSLVRSGQASLSRKIPGVQCWRKASVRLRR